MKSTHWKHVIKLNVRSMLTELLTITIYIIIFSSLQRNPILTRSHTSLSPPQPLASTHITINQSIYSLILDRSHKWHHATFKLVTDLSDLLWCFWASLFFPDVSILLLFFYVSNVLYVGTHFVCAFISWRHWDCLHSWPITNDVSVNTHVFLWVKCSFLLGTCWGALFDHVVHPCLPLWGIVKLVLTVVISFAHPPWSMRVLTATSLPNVCYLFIIATLKAWFWF